MKAAFFALALALFLSATASAQVAVYRLSFSATGEGVNYRAFENGYYVSPLGGGTGTLILMQEGSGKEKLYFTYASFGETFIASNGKTKKMVLSAVSSSGAADTTFYCIGDVNHSFDVQKNLGKPATATPTATTGTTTTTTTTGTAAAAATPAQTIVDHQSVARTMRGYEISADSQSDVVFTGNATSQGVAGVSTMSATLQEDMTTLANGQNYTLAGEVTYIQNLLEQQGFSDGRTTSTAATANGTAAK